MDTLDLVCAVCGVALHKHEHAGHRFMIRDDQIAETTVRHGHYAIVEHRSILLAKPAAGVDAIAVVPGAARWEVLNLSALLTASAVVANRVPHVIIDDGQGNQSYNFPAGGNQLAGSAVQYSAASDTVAASFDGAISLVLPYPCHLSQGWRVGFKTTALDPGDQWTGFCLIVKEWLNF
jgi:hypothetical protein